MTNPTKETACTMLDLTKHIFMNLEDNQQRKLPEDLARKMIDCCHAIGMTITAARVAYRAGFVNEAIESFLNAKAYNSAARVAVENDQLERALGIYRSAGMFDEVDKLQEKLSEYSV